MPDLFDLVIIGGGPAGAAAAIYAARKQLKTALVTPEWGGQSIVSSDIQNWIGTPHLSGNELATSLKKHVEEYQGEFLTTVNSKVKLVSGQFPAFTVALDNQQTLNTKTVLIATGSNRRQLTVPGADKFEHKGLTYCASCDGPFFRNEKVIVIGGGNAGFESAAQLLAYCDHVTLLHKNDSFKADEITVKKLLANPKFTAKTNIEIMEVKGDQVVTSLVYKDKNTGEVIDEPAAGIFVEIGAVPATDFAKEVVELNSVGSVITDPRTSQTKTEGIWAAGDCTDSLYHQNNIAAGDAVRALEDIYLFLHTK